MSEIDYRVSPPLRERELRALFEDAWPGPHAERDFLPALEKSLAYICAYRKAALVGFVNVAWDGGAHAFLLDPTVRSDLQRQGIGTGLVRRAIEAAREAGCEWLHVDFESRLSGFYRKCGFRRTEAGLIDLRGE